MKVDIAYRYPTATKAFVKSLLGYSILWEGFSLTPFMTDNLSLCTSLEHFI